MLSLLLLQWDDIRREAPRYWSGIGTQGVIFAARARSGAARVSPAAGVKSQHQRAQEAEEHGPSETHLHWTPSLHWYSPYECAAASHELITGRNQPDDNVLWLLFCPDLLTAQAGGIHRNTIGAETDSQRHSRRMGGAQPIHLSQIGQIRRIYTIFRFSFLHCVP